MAGLEILDVRKSERNTPVVGLTAFLVVLVVSYPCKDAMACQPPSEEASLLSPSGSKVPVDTALVIHANYEYLVVSTRLVGADGVEVVGEMTRLGDIRIFKPDEALLPDTDYDVEIESTGEEGTKMVTATFQTGTVAAPAGPVAPSGLTLRYLSYQGEDPWSCSGRVHFIEASWSTAASNALYFAIDVISGNVLRGETRVFGWSTQPLHTPSNETSMTLAVREPSPDLELRVCSIYADGQQRCSESATQKIAVPVTDSGCNCVIARTGSASGKSGMVAFLLVAGFLMRRRGRTA